MEGFVQVRKKRSMHEKKKKKNNSLEYLPAN